MSIKIEKVIFKNSDTLAFTTNIHDDDIVRVFNNPTYKLFRDKKDNKGNVKQVSVPFKLYKNLLIAEGSIAFLINYKDSEEELRFVFKSDKDGIEDIKLKGIIVPKKAIYKDDIIDEDFMPFVEKSLNERSVKISNKYYEIDYSEAEKEIYEDYNEEVNALKEARREKNAEKERKAAEKAKAAAALRAKKEKEKAEAEKAKEAERKRREKEAAKEAKEAEKARLLEEERLAKEAEEAEKARLLEEERLAKEAEEAEKARLEEEQRLADEAERSRLEEEARLAEQQRLEQEAENNTAFEENEISEEITSEEMDNEARRLLIKEQKESAKAEKKRLKQIQKEEKAKAKEEARLAKEAAKFESEETKVVNELEEKTEELITNIEKVDTQEDIIYNSDLKKDFEETKEVQEDEGPALIEVYRRHKSEKIKNSKKSITEKVKEVYESILASYVTWKLVRQSEKEEKARLAQEAREQMLEEQERLAKEQEELAEQQRIEDERLAKEDEDARLEEEQRLAAEAEEAERVRLEEESKLAKEQEELAEQERLAEEERLAKEAEEAEQARLEEEQRLAQEQLTEENDDEEEELEEKEPKPNPIIVAYENVKEQVKDWFDQPHTDSTAELFIELEDFDKETTENEE